MKGNMFLGYARGSVGDVVFSRTNGQQQGRARNRRPNNPRTSGQMRQRSLFANSVKFHTKGVQRLFKFAFEDKRANESDYNAFMKHNLANGVRISKQASQSPVYPALGHWQMSCGSLSEPRMTFDDEDLNWHLALPGSTESMTTFGELFACLKSAYGLREGDFVTMVHIVVNGATIANVPSIEPDSGLQGSVWNMSQYVLDSTSDEPLPSFMGMGPDEVSIYPSTLEQDIYCQGYCWIFSRIVPGGLKVSTSYLINNAVADACLNASLDDAFVELVLQSWDTTEDVILKGSLVEKRMPINNIVVSSTPPLPSSQSGIVVTTSEPILASAVKVGDIVGTIVIAGVRSNVRVVGIDTDISFGTDNEGVTLSGFGSLGNKVTLYNEESLMLDDLKLSATPI